MSQDRLTAIVFGEILVDEFPDRRVVAGASLHVAVRLARLGWDVHLVSSVGDDEDGRWIRRTLADYGVDDAMVETHAELATSTVAIELFPEGGHRFEIRRPVAWDDVHGPEELPRCDAINFGTLGIRDHRSRATLLRMLDGGSATRIVDLNLRPPDYDREVIELTLENADIVKLSDEELPEVARLLGIPAQPEAILGLGPQWVCLTKGPHGAELHHRSGSRWEMPGSSVEVVDTVGAGDAFLAGLIHGLVPAGDGARALEFAQEQALQAVGQRGGLPPLP